MLLIGRSKQMEITGRIALLSRSYKVGAAVSRSGSYA